MSRLRRPSRRHVQFAASPCGAREGAPAPPEATGAHFANYPDRRGAQDETLRSTATLQSAAETWDDEPGSHPAGTKSA